MRNAARVVVSVALLVLSMHAGDLSPERPAEKAPGFKVKTASGESLSLKQLSGKVVVLDFWATWCPPCLAEIPELQELLNTYGEKLVIISIAPNDKEEAWRGFLATHRVEWPQVFDRHQEMLRKYRVERYPTYVVIDAYGHVHARIVGVGNRPVVDYRLREALQKMRELGT